MKGKISVLVVLLAASLATCARAAAQADQQIVAGVIEQVEGRAFWRQDLHAKVVPLDPDVDTGRALHPREAVMCDSAGCQILLSIDKQKVSLTDKDKWYTLPNPPTGSPMKDYGRGGDIERGERSEESLVYSPAQGGAVWPEHFVVRWIPEPDLREVTMRIWPQAGGKNKEIWHKLNVGGTVGSLDSEEARQALLNYRKHGGSDLLELHFTDNGTGVDYPVSFTLLSVRDQQDLQLELANWAQQKDLIGYVGRANAFDRKGLYVEAAEEYERALRDTPNSRDLLARTILAHRSTGNHAREQQLNARLTALSRKRDKK
jgi:hypothetical protein